MAKGYRKPIPNTTYPRATEKLGRGFVDLSGPKRTPSLTGARYVMFGKDEYSRLAWVYFLKHKSDSRDAFRKVLADARADQVPSKFEIVRSDNGGGGSVATLERCANSIASRRNSPMPIAPRRPV